jgi:acyl carrier protein
MTREQLTRTLAEMISQVSDGEIRTEDALAGEHTLSALGFTSLARIRLIDSIEDTFGVEIDLGGDLAVFERVDALADHVFGLLGEPAR